MNKYEFQLLDGNGAPIWALFDREHLLEMNPSYEIIRQLYYDYLDVDEAEGRA